VADRQRPRPDSGKRGIQPANPLGSTPPRPTPIAERLAALTDAERLALMREAATAILDRAGVPTDLRTLTVNDIDLTLECRVHFRDFAFGWLLIVRAPSHFEDRDYPATLEVGGGGMITPLALRVMTAIDALMWTDRRTE